MGGTNDPFQFPSADSTEDPLLETLTPASEVGDEVAKNDNTNPIISGDRDINELDPAETEKHLRNLGISDPQNVQLRITDPNRGNPNIDQQNRNLLVVAEDQDGNRISTIGSAPGSRAGEILERAKQAQERVRARSNAQESQDPAAPDTGDAGAQDPRPTIGTPEEEGVSIEDLVSPKPTTAQRSTTQPAERNPLDVPVGELFSLIFPEPPESVTNTETGDESLSVESFIDVEGTEQESATQTEGNQQTEEATSQQSQQQNAQQSSPGETENVLDPRQEVLAKTGGRTGQGAEAAGAEATVVSDQQEPPGILEQVGETLQKPGVQEGLAQLAQLFVEPDSGTGQVARQLVQDAQRRQEASQIQELVAGEDVEEPESPSVLTTANELQSADSRRDLVEARTEKARLQGRLALQDAFSGEQTELEQGEVDDIVETVTSNMTGDVLSRVQEEETGLEAAGILQLLGKNPNPALVRAFASDEQRQQMEDEIVSRLVASGMDREEAIAKFGDYKQVLDEAAQGIRSAAGAEEEEGGDQQVPGSLNLDQAQKLVNEGSLQIGEGEEVTLNGRTYGPGTLQIGDNDNIQHDPR